MSDRQDPSANIPDLSLTGAGKEAADMARPVAGDLVVLRSGGPVLTIASMSGDNAHCIWFGADDAFQRAEIPLACLEPANEDDLMSDEMDFEEGEFTFSSGPDEPASGHKKKKKKKKSHDED